ncbi:MAG: hypothetical protein LBV40_06450 [Methanomicrobiales archaeon]|jgi:hypothetical protein|nr:hypothetical protein [Methanomicrobiales archaeon]
MSDPLPSSLYYEKDLVAMKYRILISGRHDAVVNDLARMSGVSKQIIRSALIYRADMILLEAIPPRYHAYYMRKNMETGGIERDQEEEAMYIFCHIIPIITEEEQRCCSLSEILLKAAEVGS